MNTAIKLITRGLLLIAASGVASAQTPPNPNTYLYGDFSINEGAGPAILDVTFDGGGGYSGTITVSGSDDNGNLITCSASISGTYSISSVGQLTLSYSIPACGNAAGSGAQVATGPLSIDGNSFLVTNSAAALQLDDLFGMREPQNDASDNYRSGLNALQSNTNGISNTATGTAALASNTTGANNTATGANALSGNTGGNDDSAFGMDALLSNSTGSYNTAFGTLTLPFNTTGYRNNAIGYQAMYANTTGHDNNAQGSLALAANTTGFGNSAMGSNSLLNLTTGERNVGVGNNSGQNLLAGSYNVDIGWGAGPLADESNTVRIGNPNYVQAAYVAGISDTRVTGAAVYVTSSGQLGVLASSERYKTDITPMTSNAEKLEQLRPVTFHLKSEPRGELQYGLIAEEVEKIYPELVIRDGKGQIQGVRYDELAPILLSQVQTLQQQLTAQADELGQLKLQMAQVQEVSRAMQAALSQTPDHGARVAVR